MKINEKKKKKKKKIEKKKKKNRNTGKERKQEHKPEYNTSIINLTRKGQGRKEMFYLTTHSTHFIYGYMASDIW